METRLKQICTALQLGPDDYAHLRKNSMATRSLENKWNRKMADYFISITPKIIKSLEETNTIQVDFDVSRIILDHAFDVMATAFRVAQGGKEVKEPVTQLSQMPRSLKELRRLYDFWRKKHSLPKKMKDQADKIKKAYLKRVQSVWRDYSMDFRVGDEATQKDVVKKIQKAADFGYARAKTTVNTETTNYYNDARISFYNQSDDVTHYLAVAVRDFATTKWCTPKTIQGKRGRHGLVYRKGSEMIRKEHPAFHWNCRTEFLPLTPLNPNHLRLIQDKSIQRENVLCHPLPAGWRS